MKIVVLFGSMLYAIIGIFIFMIAYLIFDIIAPRLKITEILVSDKNIGLGLVIAGLFIGLAIIISAAIK